MIPSDRFGKDGYRKLSGNYALLYFVGCLRDSICLYQAVSGQGKRRKERIDKKKQHSNNPLPSVFFVFYVFYFSINIRLNIA